MPQSPAFLPSDRKSTQIVHVPQVTHLDDELSLIQTLPRPEAVALVKEIRQREWGILADALRAEVFDITGMDISLNLTATTDAIVIALAKRVWKKLVHHIIVGNAAVYLLWAAMAEGS